MPLEISGKIYFSVTEVIETAGVSRQTLWRWRSRRWIPLGRRFRNRQVVFTREEVQTICSYANRLEPAQVADQSRKEDHPTSEVNKPDLAASEETNEAPRILLREFK